jgi:hypothetical protein
LKRILLSLALIIVLAGAFSWGTGRSEASGNHASIYLNAYPDGVDALPSGEFAYNYLERLGYSVDNSTNVNASYTYQRLKNDDIFYFSGHGGPGYMKFPDNSLIIACSPYEYETKLSDYQNGELSTMLLAFFNGCDTANDDPDLGNLLDEALRLGVTAAIGFKTSINNDESNYWSDRFWYYLYKGYNVGDAAYAARNDVLFKFGRFGGVDSYEIRGDRYLTLRDDVT